MASVAHMDKAGDTPHRVQNRATETFADKSGTFYSNEFNNEPDTDWSLTANRKWAESVRHRWKKDPQDPPVEIPLGGGRRGNFDRQGAARMPGPLPGQRHVIVARYRLANGRTWTRLWPQPPRIRTAGAGYSHPRATRSFRGWPWNCAGPGAISSERPPPTPGKIFTEADVEVSEAIDFAEYYPFSARTFFDMENIEARGRGMAWRWYLPWNFPIAIPCGGILAALSAGNTVIFKPASDAVLTAWLLCQCFWRAGVSRNTLQFVPCSGATIGARLVTHPEVDFVILTGGTDTGMAMLKDRPEIFLAAETGGKNATIVTAMADRDQAIKNVLYSAFGNCGQKCSATSLLILEKEVYADEPFKRQLVDAAQSFATGSAWDFRKPHGTPDPPAGGRSQARPDHPGARRILGSETSKHQRQPLPLDPGNQMGRHSPALSPT